MIPLPGSIIDEPRVADYIAGHFTAHAAKEVAFGIWNVGHCG
jgi:hypothetical protein